MALTDLPALNACLNALSATFLLLGYWQIRQKQIIRHRLCMSAALITSTLFLCSYLYYHYHHGSTKFQGQGLLRSIYFIVLLTHTVLAAVIVPLIFVTIARAFGGNFSRHRSIARWTLPLWLYVSVTGVVVYWMLYRM